MSSNINKAMNRFVMIIFGASGDLTKRKLMPALYTLYKEKRLPESFAVLGVGRTEFKRVEMQEMILDAIEHSSRSASLNHEDSTF